jgi:hypothetical protein
MSCTIQVNPDLPVIDMSLEMTDLSGKIISKINIDTPAFSINMPGLPGGIYLARLANKTHYFPVKKLVIIR